MPRSKFNFEAIGTFFEIVTDKALTNATKNTVLNFVESFDKEFSRFRDDSVVSAMAKQAGTYVFSEGSEVLLEFYEALYDSTEGSVTPLIGVSLEALGYDAMYSLQQRAVIKAPRYEDVVRRKGTKLTLSQPIVFDVGAAGKGYLVDRIGDILKQNEVADYIIDASGDILHQSKTAEQIGLEDPLNQGKVIGVVELKSAALCASATNRRRWGDGLHHIVDPSTGLPTQSIIATWVIATSTMVADGLATALFFTSPDILKQSYTYEYMRVHSDKTIEYSAGFNNTLYEEKL